MKCKFKVGDKVRIVKNTGGIRTKDKYISDIATIGKVDDHRYFPYTFEPDNGWVWRDDDLELVACNEKIVITTDGKTTTATKYCGDGEKVTATARCHADDEFDFNVGAKLAMERLMEMVAPVTYGGFKVGDRVNFGGINGTVICIAEECYADDNARIGVEFDELNVFGHHCGGISLIAGKEGSKATCRWHRPSELNHGEVVKPKYYNGKVVCVKNTEGNAGAYIVGKIYEFVNGTFKDEYGWHVNNVGNKFKSFEDWNRFSCSKWIEIKE